MSTHFGCPREAKFIFSSRCELFGHTVGFFRRLNMKETQARVRKRASHARPVLFIYFASPGNSGCCVLTRSFASPRVGPFVNSIASHSDFLAPSSSPLLFGLKPPAPRLAHRVLFFPPFSTFGLWHESPQKSRVFEPGALNPPYSSASPLMSPHRVSTYFLLLALVSLSGPFEPPKRLDFSAGFRL